MYRKKNQSFTLTYFINSRLTKKFTMRKVTKTVLTKTILDGFINSFFLPSMVTVLLKKILYFKKILISWQRNSRACILYRQKYFRVNPQ